MNKVIVGLPSYNEADSISYVAQQVDIGLQKYFAGWDKQIVNVDNSSTDGTKEAFLETETNAEKLYNADIGGKGDHLRHLFEYAVHEEADIILTVDSDLKSITPEWMKELGEPVITGSHFVTPQYARHKFDGTITNNIAFPLVYSLFGEFVRQPIGGEFGLSGEFAEHVLKQEWIETAKKFGIDIFLTSHALLGGFEHGTANLGLKVHKPSGPKLDDMFLEVVNTIFYVICSNKDKLYNGELPESHVYEINEEPPEVELDRDAVKKKAAEGIDDNEKALKDFLGAHFDEFVKDYFIDAEEWAKIVLMFLNIYDCTGKNIELLEALKYLYFARVYSFMDEAKNADYEEAERMIFEQAEEFYNSRDIIL